MELRLSLLNTDINISYNNTELFLSTNIPLVNNFNLSSILMDKAIVIKETSCPNLSSFFDLIIRSSNTTIATETQNSKILVIKSLK